MKRIKIAALTIGILVAMATAASACVINDLKVTTSCRDGAAVGHLVIKVGSGDGARIYDGATLVQTLPAESDNTLETDLAPGSYKATPFLGTATGTSVFFSVTQAECPVPASLRLRVTGNMLRGGGSSLGFITYNGNKGDTVTLTVTRGSRFIRVEGAGQVIVLKTRPGYTQLVVKEPGVGIVIDQRARRANEAVVVHVYTFTL